MGIQNLSSISMIYLDDKNDTSQETTRIIPNKVTYDFNKR
jgi:hypothetical protein